LAFAQAAPITRTVDGFLSYIVYLAGKALPLLIIAAVVLLLFGIVRLFFFDTSGTERENGKKFVGYGILALFVMVSVWGLVNVLRSTFDLDNNNIPMAPAIPILNSPAARGTAN
jgi:phosphatidylserine synthase